MLNLSGEPIEPKKRRGRKPGTGKHGEAQFQLQLGAQGHPAQESGPEARDLVTLLRPLHRRIEADLARTLAAEGELAARVLAKREALSRRQGVALSEKQYLHGAATVYVLKALFLKVAEDYGLFPPAARKVAQRGDLYVNLRGLAPRLTWADYLEYACRDLAYLPLAYDLFKESDWEAIPPSDESAPELLDTVASLPDLKEMDTRALGDLYEHLMDAEERKRLGYYTTPDYIIEFLLDRTLEPALEQFGPTQVRYLDLCCGTGHFLVRAYERFERRLAEVDPGGSK